MQCHEWTVVFQMKVLSIEKNTKQSKIHPIPIDFSRHVTQLSIQSITLSAQSSTFLIPEKYIQQNQFALACVLRVGCVPLTRRNRHPSPTQQWVGILFENPSPITALGEKKLKERERPNQTSIKALTYPFSIVRHLARKKLVTRGRGTRVGGCGGWWCSAHRKTGQYVINWKTSRAGNLWQQQQLGSSESLIDFNPWPSQAIDFTGSVEEIGRKLFWNSKQFWVLETKCYKFQFNS